MPPRLAFSLLVPAVLAAPAFQHSLCDLLADERGEVDGLAEEILEEFLWLEESRAGQVVARCGTGALLSAATRLDGTELWRGTVSDLALAAAEASQHASLAPVAAVEASQHASLALVQQELAARAGPYEGGDYLRRAAAAAPDDPSAVKNIALVPPRRRQSREAPP